LVDETASRMIRPFAIRAIRANGQKIVCRHAGPPSSERIGAITFTSWAWLAIFTRSPCRSRLCRNVPTTTASVTL
jgi:hypothetical protein